MEDKQRKSRFAGVPLFFIAVAMIVLLLNFESMELAYAWSVATYSVGADSVSIVRLGNYVYVANDAANTVRVFAVADYATLFATVTGVTGAAALFTYNNRVYAVGSTTLYEIDNTAAGTFFVSRSVGTTSLCTNTNVVEPNRVNPTTGEFICVRPSADLYRIIDLDTMTITFTSAALTATCDQPDDATWSFNYDAVILGCAVTDTLSSYTPETGANLHSVAQGAGSGYAVSQSHELNALIVTGGSATRIYSYTVAGGFVVIDSDVSSAINTDNIFYDSGGRRWLAGDTNEIVHFIDDVTGDVLSSVYTSVVAIESLYVHAFGLSYIATGASDDKFAVFNMVGIPLGSGSEEGGTVPVGGCVTIEQANGNTFEICDTDNDGILNWVWSDLPSATDQDAGDALGALWQIFGFNEDSSNLISSIIIHVLVVFGTAGVFLFATKTSPPMFVWVALLIFGGGLSAAMGVMPLLYFFVEVALVVGAVAAMIKAGVIGS